jgi:hypothetical protein
VYSNFYCITIEFHADWRAYYSPDGPKIRGISAGLFEDQECFVGRAKIFSFNSQLAPGSLFIENTTSYSAGFYMEYGYKEHRSVHTNTTQLNTTQRSLNATTNGLKVHMETMSRMRSNSTTEMNDSTLEESPLTKVCWSAKCQTSGRRFTTEKGLNRLPTRFWFAIQRKSSIEKICLCLIAYWCLVEALHRFQCCCQLLGFWFRCFSTKFLCESDWIAGFSTYLDLLHYLWNQ